MPNFVVVDVRFGLGENQGFVFIGVAFLRVSFVSIRPYQQSQ